MGASIAELRRNMGNSIAAAALLGAGITGVSVGVRTIESSRASEVYADAATHVPLDQVVSTFPTPQKEDGPLPKSDKLTDLYPVLKGLTPSQQPEAHIDRRIGTTILVANYSDTVSITPEAIERVSTFFENIAANQVPGRTSAQIRVEGALIPLNLRSKTIPEKTAIVVVPDTDAFPVVPNDNSPVVPDTNKPHLVVVRVPNIQSALLQETVAGQDAAAMLVNRAMVQAIFTATVDVQAATSANAKIGKEVMGKTLAVGVASRAVYGNAPVYGDSSSGFQRYLQEASAADTQHVPNSDTIIKLDEVAYNTLFTGKPLVTTVTTK